MKEELLFGAAYYPEYMPYDRVEQDLDMMKAAGMNVVRIAESTWSTLEPSEGTYNFSYIDHVVKEAGKREMFVIIGTPTYAIPSWLAGKDAGIMVTTKSGQAKYGPRQQMDIQNPVFRECAERIIRQLAAHTRDYPCVIGYQIDNETKHYDTYSSVVQSGFCAFCRERFGTTQAFNEAFGLAYWSNSINSWQDFPDMQGCICGGLAMEFDRYRRMLAADYLKWQADLIWQYKRDDQFITHNFDFEWRKFGASIAQDGYSYGVQPGINHYEASGALTLVGTDIYHPTQDELTGAEIAYGGDSIRSLKRENYLVLECQAQAFKQWTPYPGQLMQHAYSHLASGALGLLYWNWHSIHNGFETYWKGVLSHDLLPGVTYREASLIGEEWNRLSSSLGGIKKENQIALLVDNTCLDAFSWFPIDKDLSYNDVVRWVYDSLYELNLECDVVDVNSLDTIDLSIYRLIVTPALYCASEELILRLKEYTALGGVLVSTFKSFVADQKCSVYHDAQPHRLVDCFGFSYNQFTHPGTASLMGEKVSYFAELICVEKAECIASYEHKYWSRYAAVTRNSYQLGVSYYIGCYTEKTVLKQVLKRAAADAKIERVQEEWPVIIRRGKNKEGNELCFLFHYSEQMAFVSCPYQTAVELRSGINYSLGQQILLKDWDVAILEAKIIS